ncbi:AraC family transcriptional regulator [Hahella sp. SMD15-11]|uniref:AraC family transcriptional regulator n=1 Tax=Thermohahella caldifontis TaxID=3142973 RepID=A0AB39UUF0_9GAMM
MLHTHLSSLPQQPCLHQHPHHQLVISACGRGEIDLEGLQAPLSTLQACVVQGFASHAFFGEAGNRIIVVNLDGDEPALSDTRHPDHDALAPLFERSRLLTLPPEVRALADAALATLNRMPGDPVLARTLGTALIRACVLSERPRVVTRLQRRYRLDLARIDALIDARMGGPISVAELAGSVCLSPGWFQSVFKEETGLTPQQYVRQKRLMRARDLLCTTDWPMTRIAAETGFADASTFCHAFRRHFGMPPTRLRS